MAQEGAPVAGTIGQGARTYEVAPGWGRSPERPAPGLVSGVAGDAADNVYVFQRTPESAVLVYDREGRLQRALGLSAFPHAHGIWLGHVGPATGEPVLLLTDRERHQVLRYTPAGERLDAWGTAGTPGAPGAPFNQPARAVATPDGELLARWGERGAAPGQFAASPHSLWLDSRGDLYVGEVTTPDRFQKFVRR
jgi:hypothetical protein